MLILFYWDGETQIVQDVDYFLWGDYDKGVFKSTSDGYTFDDTILENQKFIRSYLSSDFYDSLYVRLILMNLKKIKVKAMGLQVMMRLVKILILLGQFKVLKKKCLF